MGVQLFQAFGLTFRLAVTNAEKGNVDGTYTDVRTILREALLQRATQIAVVHNHPSGNIRPSQPDKTLTEHIRKAAP